MQACATSVACVHAAAAGGDGVRLVVVTDRTSNGPHVVYPAPARPAGRPPSENWVLDSFGCDPNTGEGMLATAERVAAQGEFSKAEIDAVTARRWDQYEDALRRRPCVPARWMVPITAGSKRKPVEIDEDWGIRPAPLEALEGLPAVEAGGVVSYGSQTHPADGCAGLIVTTRRRRTGGPDPGQRASRGSGAARCRRPRSRRPPPRSPTPGSRSRTST